MRRPFDWELMLRDASTDLSGGEEYRFLKEEIADKLRALKDPDTGERIVADVYLREEIYHGLYLDRAPDILFLPKASGFFAGSVTGFFSNRWIFENSAWPGNHRMEGILLARGKHINKGKRFQGARLIDLAPTLLHLLGNRIPADMDGRVLTDLFVPGFLRRQSFNHEFQGSRKRSGNQ